MLENQKSTTLLRSIFSDLQGKLLAPKLERQEDPVTHSILEQKPRSRNRHWGQYWVRFLLPGASCPLAT